jgi:hypothetical protein
MYSVGHPRYAQPGEADGPPRRRSNVGYALWVIIDALLAGIVLTSGLSLFALVVVAGSRGNIDPAGLIALGGLSITVIAVTLWLVLRLERRTYLRGLTLVAGILLAASPWLLAALA